MDLFDEDDFIEGYVNYKQSILYVVCTSTIAVCM